MAMKTIMTIMAMFSFLVIAGCSTSAGFKLPPDTTLLIKGERVTFEEKVGPEGYPVLETKPYFWDSVIGIKYSLVQNEKVVKEGELPAQFRVVSIFWPPYAVIYWPFGFRMECYDLTKEFIEECPPLNITGQPKQTSN
jgi:hypothetical protein